MSKVNTYLNFKGDTEEAFNYYATVFGTEFLSPIVRFGDMPANPDMPALSPDERNQVMHVELPILAGHVLMGTDMLASMGHELRIGNNTTISLELDSREEADRVFAALSSGGSDKADMQDMPWGAYWGVCLDRFGIRWMFSFTDPDHQAH
jgi:PhnB protein